MYFTLCMYVYALELGQLQEFICNLLGVSLGSACGPAGATYTTAPQFFCIVYLCVHDAEFDFACLSR